RRRRQNDFVVDALAKLSTMPSKRHAKSIAKTNQRLANLQRKQNDDRDTDVQQSIAEHKLKRREILFDGEPVKENESGDSGGHRRGASAAQALQNCIHQQKDKDDVRDVPRLNHPS